MNGARRTVLQSYTVSA
uniref:Uncharacterized protein n=1 Tax=Rhizophora mucronata TaxID=61149 RepID=A0A2P2QE99_RHIMU